MRKLRQRHSYVHFHSLVHLVRDVLAAGIVGTRGVSDRVAVPAAIPDRGYRGARCARPSLGDRDAACAADAYAIPGLNASCARDERTKDDRLRTAHLCYDQVYFAVSAAARLQPYFFSLLCSVTRSISSTSAARVWFQLHSSNTRR